MAIQIPVGLFALGVAFYVWGRAQRRRRALREARQERRASALQELLRVYGKKV